MRFNPDVKLVAQLSQNMNFVLEMTVREFLLLHAECRGGVRRESLVDEVLRMRQLSCRRACRSG